MSWPCFLAAVQERACEVIEGALAGLLFTAVALQAGLVVIRTPGTNIVALTPRTLERPIFPAQHMHVRLTRFGVEELFQMRNNRNGWASPVITGSVKKRIGDSQLTIECLRCYKPREIERFALRYRRMSPEMARQALIATHGGLSLEWSATMCHLSPMALSRLL